MGVGVFFQLNFGTKFMKSDIVFWRCVNFFSSHYNRSVKSWFWEVWESRQSIGIIAIQKSKFFTSNPSRNIKSKYWRFQNMWNLKIDLGTIFWDILTLHPKAVKYLKIWSQAAGAQHWGKIVYLSGFEVATFILKMQQSYQLSNRGRQRNGRFSLL